MKEEKDQKKLFYYSLIVLFSLVYRLCQMPENIAAQDSLQKRNCHAAVPRVSDFEFLFRIEHSKMAVNIILHNDLIYK